MNENITKLILLVLLSTSFHTFSQEKKVSLESMTPKLKTSFRPKVLSSGRGWITISDSVENGKYKIYTDKEMKVLYATGQVTEHTKEGAWMYYYSNGKKHISLNYVHGKIEGTLVRFTYAGDTACVYQMKNNMANGAGKEWSDRDADMYANQGRNKRYLTAKSTYRNDTLISESVFYPSGTQSQESMRRGDTLVRKTYTFNGHLSSIYHLIGFRTVKEEKFEGKTAESIYNVTLNLAQKKDLDVISKLSTFVNLETVSISIPTLYPSPDSILNDALNQLVLLQHLRGIYLHAPVDPDYLILEKLTNLTQLEISCPTVINAGIVKLTNLESLSLLGNTSSEQPKKYVIPSGIKALKNLRSLSIKNMQFQNPETEIIKLKPLTKLYALSLPNCSFAKVPLALGAFKQLSYLDLAGYPDKMENQIKLLPDTLLKLKNLRYLRLPGSIGYEAHTTLLPKYRKRMPSCVFDIYESCFPEEVRISMLDGTEKSIKDVQTGDILLCLNEITNQLDSTVVLETGCNQVDLKMEIEIQTSGSLSNLKMTSEHPVFVKGLGWRIASQLKAGDVVYHYDPDNKKVAEFSIILVKSYSSVDTKYYNLKTSKASYFANGIWVHNK